jgi:tetratricopeptide (TPR) repeat protein
MAETPDISAADLQTVLDGYESATQKAGADFKTLASYGVLLWRLFRFRQADPLFQRATIDPCADPDTLRTIAQCYFSSGRFRRAADVMRVAAHRAKPDDVVTLNTLAWTLERDHQTDEAREYAELAHVRDPSYGPAVRLLAHLDRRAGDWERSAERLEEQLRRYPSDFDWGLRYELASVYDRLSRYDEAWANLGRAKAQLEPQVAQPLRDSYRVRRRQWEFARSITAADLRRWRAAGVGLTPIRRIAFLTGFPRSGTTLLEQMLAVHADAIDTDETGILPGQFIEPIVWRAADTLDALLEIRSFQSAQLAAGREQFYELTESYLDEPVGERLLIEKNPLLTADLGLPLRLFPEALLVIALRDPRDVVLSYLFTMVPLNWSSAPAVNVAEACRFYAETLRHWLWWRAHLEWPWQEVRYEAMIADPRSELQRLASFLGLAWDDAMIDEGRRSERRAVRTPTYDDVTKPLYTRAIGRWRHYEQYLQPDLAVLRPLIESLGYPL